MVITTVGAPAAVIGPPQDIGWLVLADVASLRRTHEALEAGADGLVPLAAGLDPDALPAQLSSEAAAVRAASAML